MAKDSIQFTADNMRADFLNATTNWARWQVFNRALAWAVTSSELNGAHRQDRQTGEKPDSAPVSQPYPFPRYPFPRD